MAELAAAGQTNRQIANALFITVKAVEWHLSNAYRRLDISGRTELSQALAASRRRDRLSPKTGVDARGVP